MHRFALAWIAAAALACGGRGAPAWPKDRPAEAADDGGESLAPRVATSVEGTGDSAEPDADLTSTDVLEKLTGVATPAAKPAATDTPAVKEPEPLTTEEIIIEIEE